MRISEVIFEVTEAIEGGYDARALGYSIFTQGDDWEDLKDMVKDAALCYFDDDETMPRVIRLHLVKDEVLAVRGCQGTCGDGVACLACAPNQISPNRRASSSVHRQPRNTFRRVLGGSVSCGTW